MKVRDVPQDPGSHYPSGFTMYAVDDDGRYQSVESKGNDIGTLANRMVWERYDEDVAAAAAKVRSGELSPLAFFIALKIMDSKLLAKYVGMARWRVSRHLKPAVFAKLKPAILQKYADFFGVAVEDLVSPSLEQRELLFDGERD
jgi:hypothetical protein